MPPTPYRIALASRGAGAFAYTYTGPGGLERGQLAAVRFRNRLELGVVLGPDDAPPVGVTLLPLLPVRCAVAGWGALLLDLCELACAAPDELLPRLALSGSAKGLRLSLRALRPQDIPPEALAELEPCRGQLTPARRKALLREPAWQAAQAASDTGAAELLLDFTGQPGVTSTRAALRYSYGLTAEQRALHGLGHRPEEWWPGGYLAGLAEPPQLAGLPRRTTVGTGLAPSARGMPCDDDDRRAPARPPATQLDWGERTGPALSLPADWDIALRWPAVAALPLRRTLTTWPSLRAPDGLPAELARAVAAGERVLLIAPQAWLLDRLWPLLADLAPSLLRHDSADPPGVLAHTLFMLAGLPTGGPHRGLVVAGTEAAWRLAVYAAFDRAILIDPTHPQWQPEGAPHLDPRGALLRALAQWGGPPGPPTAGRPTGLPCLDIVELGLSAFDGALLPELRLLPPHDPSDAPPGPPGSLPADTNPLPLELRQPHLRRLVYFNRLGASRGLVCAECGSAVRCPRCGSRAMHYSAQAKAFACPDCGLSERELRCPRCGLGTLAARLPGLEAMRVRPGELLVQGPQPPQPGPDVHTVLGTAQLLEPLPGFWPEQIVYVDPEERDLLGADWRSALDMAARLAALYANPALGETCIVSARLAGRVAEPRLTPAAAAVECVLEGRLRKLGGLPPYGCLYHLRALADAAAPLPAVRELLGARLSQHAGTALLRLGKPFTRAHRAELHGYLLNPELGWPELQELRWEVNAQGASLGIAALRGPWL